jgi:hypothetical protein
MSTSSAKTTEALRALDIDQSLAERLRQDQLENRDRKIARIGHLWERRRHLGKFLSWDGVAVILIAPVLSRKPCGQPQFRTCDTYKFNLTSPDCSAKHYCTFVHAWRSLTHIALRVVR